MKTYQVKGSIECLDCSNSIPVTEVRIGLGVVVINMSGVFGVIDHAGTTGHIRFNLELLDEKVPIEVKNKTCSIAFPDALILRIENSVS